MVKRALIFTQYFWPEDFRINDMASALSENSFQLEVVTGIPNYPKGSFFPGYGILKPFLDEYQGIKIFRLPIIPRGKTKLSLALNYLSFTTMGFLSIIFLLFRRYDLIVSFGASPATAFWPGAVLAKLKRIRSVIWVLDLWPESLEVSGLVKAPQLIRMIRPIFMVFYNLHSLVLVQSRAFQEHFSRYGFRNEKVIYFPNWSESFYQPLPNKPRRDELVILYAGNLGEAQDLKVLLDAAERTGDIKNIKWIVLGDGRKSSWLQDQVKTRSLSQIELVGRRPAEEMPDWFNKADVLYVSLKSNEFLNKTLPGRVQSFMASRKPIISVADGETRDVIEQAGCGWTVPSGDVDSLESLLRGLVKLPDFDFHSRAQLGFDYYNKWFARSSRCEALIQLIRNLLRDNRSNITNNP